MHPSFPVRRCERTASDPIAICRGRAGQSSTHTSPVERRHRDKREASWRLMQRACPADFHQLTDVLPTRTVLLRIYTSSLADMRQSLNFHQDHWVVTLLHPCTASTPGAWSSFIKPSDREPFMRPWASFLIGTSYGIKA
ncbi:unnamed protein product [Pleuronectes platessa]|uniref:Uncharacterized protein n=1 Tax=Pleuronectes platessa TaxID=8262 RepID=A0A9N7Z062_PLEPL|nr:unnamed protein product [Pleuronectes platessa]